MSKIIATAGIGMILYVAYTFIHGVAAHLNAVLNLAAR